MGDSWTWGTGTWYSGYAGAWALANSRIPFFKIAQPGWKLANLMAMVGMAALFKPKSISIVCGINDFNVAGTPSVIAAQYMIDLQALVAALKLAIPGVKVFVATVPPSTSGNVNSCRVIVNPDIRAASGTWHDGVIPIGDYLSDADASDTNYYNNGTPPGHPQALLETIMTAILGAVLNPFYAGANDNSPSAASMATIDVYGAVTSQAYTAFPPSGPMPTPITGMASGYGATAVVTGDGTFKIGRGGTSDTSDKTVFNGDVPFRTVTASATSSPATLVTQTLTIGSTADTFNVTTGDYVSDNFNRSAGAPGSTLVGGLPYIGPATIDGSNQVQLGQNHGYIAFDPAMYDFDFTLDVVVPTNFAGSGRPWVFFFAERIAVNNRWDDAFARLWYYDPQVGKVYSRIASGAVTQRGNNGTSAASSATPHTVRVRASLSLMTVEVYLDGVLDITATIGNNVTMLPAGTFCGVTETFINSSIKIDNLLLIAA